MKTIGEIFKSNLRRFRDRMPGDVRQEDMDERLGLPPNTYQRWEAGKLPREDERISALAELFGVDVGELFLDPDLTTRATIGSPTIGGLTKIIEQQERRISELEAQLEAVKKPAEQPAKHSLAAVEPSPVSPEEQRLLNAWRRMDEPQRSLILDDIRDFQIIDDERADPFSAAKAFQAPVAKKPGSR